MASDEKGEEQEWYFRRTETFGSGHSSRVIARVTGRIPNALGQSEEGTE
jgi:hypothetical protein